MSDFVVSNEPRRDRGVITVIIPTLCKYEPASFRATMNALNCSRFVKDIIIIDNSGKFRDEGWEKLEVVSGENLYVNPAWNLGVKKSETPYYLLLNDDTVLDGTVLNECLNAIKDYDLLVIDTAKMGLAEYMSSVPRHNEQVSFIDCKFFHEGAFIMGKTDKYIPIPEELKIFFGDYWLYSKLKCCKVISTYISHYGQTTVNAENKYGDGTLERERAIYNQLRGANADGNSK
jgi:hypothetical protein